MTGIPMYNVNNNCSTGSTALLLAKNIIAGGQADCVLAVGFEKMERGSLKAKVGIRFEYIFSGNNITIIRKYLEFKLGLCNKIRKRCSFQVGVNCTLFMIMQAWYTSYLY